jgi:hypothetical protein
MPTVAEQTSTLPAYVMQGLAACGAILGLLGCSRTDATTVEVRGVTYKIPKHLITGSVFPPDGDIYVRIAPEGRRFHLLIDEKRHGWPNKMGPTVPTISTLNENLFWTFDLIHTSHGPIVCKREIQPHFNCGFKIRRPRHLERLI